MESLDGQKVIVDTIDLIGPLLPRGGRYHVGDRNPELFHAVDDSVLARAGRARDNKKKIGGWSAPEAGGIHHAVAAAGPDDVNRVVISL
jgi:hypothetical protein